MLGYWRKDGYWQSTLALARKEVCLATLILNKEITLKVESLISHWETLIDVCGLLRLHLLRALGILMSSLLNRYPRLCKVLVAPIGPVV